MTSVHFPSPSLRRSAGWLALTLLTFALATETSCAAPLQGALSPDLALVPRDAAGFAHIRAADLWQNETLADLRYIVHRAGPETYKEFVRKVGPDPAIIDRITFVLLTPRTLGEPFPGVDPEALSALVIVRTSKPYDRLQVRKLLGQREKVYRRHLYHFNEEMWSGLAFMDNQTFVIGSEDALVQFFDRLPAPNADGPLQDALVAASEKHVLTMGLNPQLLGKEPGAQVVPPPLLKLLEARCATLTLDLAKETRLALRLSYAKDDEAQAGEKALRGALELARAGLAPGIQELEAQLKKPSDEGPVAELAKGFALVAGLGMLREIDGQLKDLPIQRQGTAVSIAVSSKRTDAGSLAVVSMGAIGTLGRVASRSFSRIGSSLNGGKDPTEVHLKKLAAALDKYHQEKGAYPAPAIYDKDGRPLLSWRVALLPYLDQDALYREFRLDEPWDSLHNKKLLKKLPQVFKAPNTYSRNKTTDLVFSGENAAFTPKKGIRKEEIVGPAIILVAAASDSAVYWSKPADLIYQDHQPLPKLFGKYGYQQIKVLLANGTCQTLTPQTDEQALRAMIKRTAPKKDK